MRRVCEPLVFLSTNRVSGLFVFFACKCFPYYIYELFIYLFIYLIFLYLLDNIYNLFFNSGYIELRVFYELHTSQLLDPVSILLKRISCSVCYRCYFWNQRSSKVPFAFAIGIESSIRLPNFIAEKDKYKIVKSCSLFLWWVPRTPCQ